VTAIRKVNIKLSIGEKGTSSKTRLKMEGPELTPPWCSREKIQDIIKVMATKQELIDISVDSTKSLKIKLECPNKCMGDKKHYLVVIGKRPNQLRALVTNEEEGLLTAYTYCLAEFH